MLISFLLCPANIWADGLIIKLPKDGTSAEFVGDDVGYTRQVLPKFIADNLTKKEIEEMEAPNNGTQKRKVTISSVGEMNRASQPCRWIEISDEMEDVEKGRAIKIKDDTLKMLVPERNLGKGQDAMSHTILTFWNSKYIDNEKTQIEKGFNQIQYQLDSFRLIYPPVFSNKSVANKRSITTAAGTFANCDVIAGDVESDYPCPKETRWTDIQKWEILTHPDAPFGVVEISCDVNVECFGLSGKFMEAKKHYKLTLNRVEYGVKSRLPENGKKPSQQK